ncbi:undecaprenyl-diphosphatase [Saccharopolyspora erythraea NRRL 2338]|uniref:Glycerophosphatase n=2 Tax=Saccharopolyspora erythraea TaxID=1836 RepID=A4FBY3_SACEN|nr:phosphatase PAP2 family protein [Saccharopolyspora erythraea]EQD84087.1 glycerophosphatase [Saccharopolyspora erythraea D]PFG95330.1 undecaprenyl-diphosphatase [Saccharopolyspora erythraea NRRL 2338]QRK91974.1 phosphatase PAP2 family protein [Saccharopolyspora erythraea]CAM01558.1 putative glycerophosphatase [Saccharopolyspora erythraea NRRL 2338]
MLQWFRRVIDDVNAFDRVLAGKSAGLPRSVADPGLKALSTAANHSLLWLTVAAALSGGKGVTRRAAFRGVAAIAGASATTNLIGKPLFPRRRPAAELMPPHRRLDDPPTSSSFPSGHAASAAAFATAVAMESPKLGAAVAPVAAAVAYSRVHTGVHWPTDVVCGAAVGAGMAWATKRWWPVRPAEPAASNHPAEAPALIDGRGMLVLVNAVSGNGQLDPEQWVRTHWPAAAVVRAEPANGLIDGLREELERRQDRVRALGVAGGDGTVAAVAALATERGLPLAVLSTGTLNHFARDIGVEHLPAVSDSVAAGSAATVDLGGFTVDDRPTDWFINTASLGGYPDMVRFREKWEPRWGKWPAAAMALVRVLHESEPLEVDINGERHRVWVLFVGNGAYAPRGFAPTWRPRLDNGTLDVRFVRADRRFSRLRFVLAAITGALDHSHTYVERECSHLEVAVHGSPVSVATDGEVHAPGRRFTFTAHENVLSVYRPTTAD